MVKLFLGLLALLCIAIAVGVVRKLRGGTLLPPPMEGEEASPRNLAELHERRKR
jgi:hypothetical protein